MPYDYNEDNRVEKLRKEQLGTDGTPPSKPWGQGFFWKTVTFLLTNPVSWLVFGLLLFFALTNHQADQQRPSRVNDSIELDQIR